MSETPPDPSVGGAEPNLQRQRDDARRSLLRANTAVALVLLVVLALAVAAVWLGWRATQAREDSEAQQQRAEQAETKARADLWRAYVSEARATRLGDLLERRTAALESIRRAAAIGSSPELRNEAVATLALPGFKLESSFPLDASVNKFAFDPALQRCALGLLNGDIVIHTLADGREQVRLRRRDGNIPDEQHAVGGLEFSADGRRLSARYGGGAFAIWDIETKRVLLLHDADKQRRLASDARFSSDGRHVVAPVFSPQDGMAVFEIESGRPIAYFGEFSSFRHASVRPGAPMFAANNGTNVVVVNWETKERVEFPFAGGVRRTAWSPDGNELVIGGNQLDVHVWNFATRERRVFSGHKGDVWELAWDPFSTRLATSSEDGTSRIWDLRNNSLVGVTSEGYVYGWSQDERIACARLRTALDVRRLAVSPVYQSLGGAPGDADAHTMDVSVDGNWAASAVEKRGLLFWNLNALAAPQWYSLAGLRSLCFHPTESRLLLTTADGPRSLPYSVVTNEQRVSVRFDAPVLLSNLPNARLDLVTVSTDGRTMAWVELAGGNVWVQPAGAKPVRMRGIRHSSVIYHSSSARGAGSISLSPDGQWLVCGYAGGRTKVFDARKGEEVATLSRGNANVQFSPDGRFVVVAEREYCGLFRAGDWTRVWQIPCAPSVTSDAPAAFSPDGATIAVAKSARAAALIDTATGRELTELEAPAAAPITVVRWAGDARRLVFSTRASQLDVWQPLALRQELAALGLDWNAPDRPVSTVLPSHLSAPRRSPAAWIAAGALLTVSLVAVVAVLSLRRHRKLIVDFTRTEALAARRERELQGERELSRLKSNFVSMVSHEFRTPLGIIQSSAQILDRYLDRLPMERRREQVGSITRNVRRMAGLIDEVLLLGKVEAGRMSFTPAPTDLPSFCRRITDEMLSATHRRCPIELRCEGEFPPAHTDENLLRHVLGNLLGNAVKYSPPGSTVEFHVSRQNGRSVFTVRDRGIGIPASEQGKIFEAFQRASNAAEFHGTGLGLTIVKRCVELHGGEVSFRSEENQGTTFTVSVPMFESTASAPEPHPAKSL